MLNTSLWTEWMNGVTFLLDTGGTLSCIFKDFSLDREALIEGLLYAMGCHTLQSRRRFSSQLASLSKWGHWDPERTRTFGEVVTCGHAVIGSMCQNSIWLVDTLLFQCLSWYGRQYDPTGRAWLWGLDEIQLQPSGNVLQLSWLQFFSMMQF